MRAAETLLEDLRSNLLELWATPSVREERAKLPLPALVHAGASHLKGGKRLLLIFDQFEDVLLLPGNGDILAELHGIFRNISMQPVAAAAARPSPLPPVQVLLSFRSDYQTHLAPLDLPPMYLGIGGGGNAFVLQGFTEDQARRYLKEAGVPLSDERVDLAINEAKGYQVVAGRYQPVVLNLLGLILSTLRGDPRAWQKRRDLIPRTVRGWIMSTSLEERIAPVLQHLVSAENKPVIRTEQEAAAAAEQNPMAVRQAFNDLESFEVLHCLAATEKDPALRPWRLRHDFLCQVLTPLLATLQQTLWRALHPWLAPACLSLVVLLLMVISPYRREFAAIEKLNSLGFSYDKDKRQLSIQRAEMFGQVVAQPQPSHIGVRE
ncbi:MAG: hypothetical protein JNG86_22125 [Verrucomicrobiaceae bacterium]|nr:hypothetical protein [Verrucomicrobiaceae bacterium]